MGRLSGQASWSLTPLKLVDSSNFSVLLFELPCKTSRNSFPAKKEKKIVS